MIPVMQEIPKALGPLCQEPGMKTNCIFLIKLQYYTGLVMRGLLSPGKERGLVPEVWKQPLEDFKKGCVLWDALSNHSGSA